MATKLSNSPDKTSLTIKILKKLAPKVGARLLIEPKWQHSAQLIYKNGVVKSVHNFSSDLNPSGSSHIARDKNFTKFFLTESGFPVIEGDTVLSPSWAKAMGSKKTISFGKKYAKKLGYPVIVKPNSKSEGMGVSLVSNSKELVDSLEEIFSYDKVALIEEYIPGRDYRVLVLDGKIVFSHERVPLFVLGDGKSSIEQLFQKRKRELLNQGRNLYIDLSDKRIQRKLKNEKYTPDSVLAKGELLSLLYSSNLSTGGDFVDVTNDIHQGFKNIATRLVKKMGLRICGVDILIRKGDITQDPKDCQFYIIEINSAPAFNHFMAFSPKNKKIIEAMYLEILKALGKK